MIVVGVVVDVLLQLLRSCLVALARKEEPK